MTIWFLLLKMKCLNPQRKCLYCISLIKPLFYYGISFYERRQDVHVELNADAWGKGGRERPTTCSHKVPPLIWQACQTFILKYAGKWARPSAHAHCGYPCVCSQSSGLLCISWAGSSRLLRAYILKAWLTCYLRSFHSAYWIQLS